ncbi:hydrogenase maturation protease [Dehalococcoidia bacterium]|nr:hydrogenase maturation protease [Dehalococcoidia bacterium]MCL0090159.1 hydrogenase maturation protease [Dehalococcoidia bacterium]
MKKTLVIGFGNVHRRDDGVGFVVINSVRERLGRPPLDAEDDGFDDLGHEIDTLLLHQLVPDMAEMIAGYDLVIFVDAHVGIIPELLREEEVIARCETTTVPHQLHPRTVLALAHQLYGGQSRGVLLSIRGHDFDFGEGLSTQTAALVPAAVNRVLALARPSKWDLRVESAAR